MQLPKNVMQYGEIDSHIKIYMEDYVHTFLEQSKRAEVYLVFGKKEDRGEVSCYMIYGVERKSDWDRGNYPYFKKYERLGTLDGPADRRIFRPTRGNSVALDGYFVFYEQNEDMQSYMITVKERDSIPGSEEKEEVMEAVRLRRELRRQGDGGNQERKDGRKDVGAEGGQIGTEQAATAERKDMAVRNAAERGEAERGAFAEKIAMEMKERHRTKKEDRAEQRKRAAVFGRRQNEYERNGTQSFRSRTAFSKSAGKSAKILQRAEKRVHRNGPVRIPKTIKRKSAGRPWTVPQLCRLGCIVLALLLVVVGLTSVNRYPDMVAVTKMFSEAVGAIRDMRGGRKEDTDGQSSLIIEETQLEVQEASDDLSGMESEASVIEGNGSDAFESGREGLSSQTGAEVNWRIGQSKNEEESEEMAEDPVIESEKEPSEGSQEELERDFAATAETEPEERDAEKSDEQGSVVQENAADTQETESVQQALARPKTYIVKRGDNLAAISRRFYGSDEMVREICALNEIKNPDQIVPGQNILLP